MLLHLSHQRRRWIPDTVPLLPVPHTRSTWIVRVGEGELLVLALVDLRSNTRLEQKRQSVSIKTTCVRCGADTYSCVTGASECFDYVADTYSGTTGATTCVSCGADTYLGTTGGTSETTCVSCGGVTYSFFRSGTACFYCRVCVRSWLSRHPANMEITRSSGGASHHTKSFFI